jgi:hypothetical protein
MKNDGGPAFPVVDHTEIDGEYNEKVDYRMDSHGLSLRDWFAGQALIGILSCPVPIKGHPEAIAYGFADAMLAERAKS